MLEADTKLITDSGKMIPICDIKPNSYVMLESGRKGRVKSLRRDIQTTYHITQTTKHREEQHKKKQIFQRIEFSCTMGHLLSLKVPLKPKLEKSLTRQLYLVKSKMLVDFQTNDGRIISIPKDRYKHFPMTLEGEYAAKHYMENIEKSNKLYLDFKLEVRDIDYLTSHIRAVTLLSYSPIIHGNSVLSHYLTGKHHLMTPSVKSMAWLLGLWIGDGTTREPEISMDSLDTSLYTGLLERCVHWGINPTYKDATIPLRAKHVKLYYGESSPHLKHRKFRTDNPFWKCLTDLKFKREDDGIKQIPEFMWTEDLEIREAFLAGLIDSDGYVSQGQNEGDRFCVSIQTIYLSVMDGITNIARSLGIKVSVTTKPERTNIIEGRIVQCRFTYECVLVGTSPLHQVLSYCRSGHKQRSEPKTVVREPNNFTFSERKKGINWVYGIELENDCTENILLSNKVVIPCCNNGHCHHEPKKCSQPKNLKRCMACSKVGNRHFYRDWSGKQKLCAKCHARYLSTGYRCLQCNYVPDQRSLRLAKQRVVFLNCERCNGKYCFDEIRGPQKKQLEVMSEDSNITENNYLNNMIMTRNIVLRT